MDNKETKLTPFEVTLVIMLTVYFVVTLAIDRKMAYAIRKMQWQVDSLGYTIESANRKVTEIESELFE